MKTEPSSEITITRTPADTGTGMTIDELGAWLQECHRAGIPGDTKVNVKIGWRQQIQRIWATT